MRCGVVVLAGLVIVGGSSGVYAQTSAPDTSVHRGFLARHCTACHNQRLKTAGLELLYLPRYAPDLSPIEPLWAKVKAALRAAAARTVAALEAALVEALAAVTAADARGFFRVCGYVLSAT